MSVLSESFFALVRIHFRTFTFFSARHNEKILMFDLFCVLLNSFHEIFAGLESGDIVSLDRDGFILGNVTGGLLSSVFYDETAETSQINVLTINHSFLHSFHESFDDGLHAIFLITSAIGNFINDFCFSHNLKMFKV